VQKIHFLVKVASGGGKTVLFASIRHCDRSYNVFSRVCGRERIGGENPVSTFKSNLTKQSRLNFEVNRLVLKSSNFLDEIF
jgi:hypothetical protein